MAAVAAIHRNLQAMNVEVLAISTDSVYSHKVFLETSPSLKNVSYPLLSDRTQEISRAYRVLDENTGAAFRASFFINPEQVIVAKLVYPREIGRNIDEHVRLFEALQYSKVTGKGTPANWKSGQSGVTKDPKKVGRM